MVSHKRDRLAQTSHTPEQDVPIPNQWKVYSQTHLGTPIRGVLNANNFNIILSIRVFFAILFTHSGHEFDFSSPI